MIPRSIVPVTGLASMRLPLHLTQIRQDQNQDENTK